MALCRLFTGTFSKLVSINCIPKPQGIKIATLNGQVFIQERCFGKHYGRKLRVMKLRRKIAGPERVIKRNEWDNWNYKAEIFAFNYRLHENISEETLRCAFIHQSYIESEERKRKELEIPTQDVPLDLKSNLSLISRGNEISSDFIKRYLRHCYPLLPEEGVIALHIHLLSDGVLSYISSNIGTKDLIFSEEYPPSESTLAATLLAIIGSISTDNGVTKAELFVLDFVCMQLIGKDVFEIWDLPNPAQVLNTILEKHGMQPYEPRVIFESGRNTIESIYNIGLYSNKTFLGKAAGETLAIAEELAAYDCLRKLFGIRDAEKPLSSKELNLDELSSITKPNSSVDNWYSETFKVRQCL